MQKSRKGMLVLLVGILVVVAVSFAMNGTLTGQSVSDEGLLTGSGTFDLILEFLLLLALVAGICYLEGSVIEV